MDEIAKILVASSPLLAVVLLLGNSALQIWKEEQVKANAKRDEILDKIAAVNTRLARIEERVGIVPRET